MLAVIAFYRRIVSPLLPPRCRFYPTCSQYAYQAIERHGALKGGCLAFMRVIRCHPFNEGGYDPVPSVVRFRREPLAHTAEKEL